MPAERSSQDFESLAIGDLAGFVNDGPADFAVRAAGAISGTKAFGPSVSNVNDNCTLSATIPADGCWQFPQEVVDGDAGGNSRTQFAVLRKQPDGGGVYIGWNPFLTTNSVSILKFVAGAYDSVLDQGDSPATFVEGEVAFLKVECEGTAFRAKVWKQGSAEPGSWQATATDATFASGKFGLSCRTAGTVTGVPTIDDLYHGDVGATFPAASSFAITGATSGSAGTPVVLTITPNLAGYVGVLTPVLAGGLAGTFSPTTVTFAGQATRTVGFTPASGSGTVDFDAADSLASAGAHAFAVGAASGTSLFGVTVDFAAEPAGAPSVAFKLQSADGYGDLDDAAALRVDAFTATRYGAIVALPAIADGTWPVAIWTADAEVKATTEFTLLGPLPIEADDSFKEAIREEIDANSTKLDVTVGSRLAGSSYTAPPSAGTVAAAILDDPANKLVTDDDGFVTATNGGGSGGTLDSDGLDDVVIESGINMRQAMALILAASAGKLAGAGTGSIVIKGANNTTTRITATTDEDGNRTVVTLSPPA